MEYTDRELTCVDCNESFIFSADDQSYHAEKGYENEPKRCSTCRAAKRSSRNSMGRGGGFGNRGPREMHTICLLYTSPSPRDGLLSRMPSSA